MKKILAVILVVASILLMASCEDNPIIDGQVGLDKFVSLYEASAPTKVVTNYTTKLGGTEFVGSSTLVTGVLNNGKTATVLISEREVIQTIEAGAGDVIKPVMGDPIKETLEYAEGYGVRKDGGKWDKNGKDFAPTAGSIAITLKEELITDVNISAGSGAYTLSFTVPAANIEAVFGNAYGITSDAKVVISADGATVNSLTITYTSDIVSADEEIVYPTAEITISVSYTYDLEKVTLVK